MLNNKLDNRRYEADINDIHLLIEITDYCNCKCIMCKHGNSNLIHGNIPKQHMNAGLFMKIINDLKDGGMKVSSIDPLWCGESMIHPDFKEMMRYLFAINKSHELFNGFILNTNAITMDEELSDIFLDYAQFINRANNNSYYMTLYFSLDAIYPNTYQKIKGISGENLNRVINNIQCLVKKRKQYNTIFPNLVFAFIVMQENKEDALEFGNFWKNFLESLDVPYVISPNWKLLRDRDTIYYKQLLLCKDSKENEELHKNICLQLGLVEDSKNIPIVETENIEPLRMPCGALWRTPNIASNGDVVPCCRDVDLTMALGNVKEYPLRDIWANDRITELRTAHIKGEFSISPLCLSCSEPEGGIISDDQIYKYLQSINRAELMGIYLNRKQKYCNQNLDR